MHVILTTRQQGNPALRPEWTNLGWFQYFRAITANVEKHYHDVPEIWLWHEGGADVGYPRCRDSCRLSVIFR